MRRFKLISTICLLIIAMTIFQRLGSVVGPQITFREQSRQIGNRGWRQRQNRISGNLLFQARQLDLSRGISSQNGGHNDR